MDAELPQPEQQQERWIPGKNGGRLRVGTVTPGPKRETTLVRRGILAALRDKRGGSGAEFWVKLKCGNAEDRRAFANICSRLLPVEVRGEVDSALTVIVQTMTGERVERHLPMDGMCVPVEDAQIAPIAAPNESETP